MVDIYKKVLLGTVVVAVVLAAGCTQETTGQEPKLSDFPEAFQNDTLVVVGDDSSPVEKETAKNISSYIRNKVDGNPKIVNYSSLSQRGTYNLIVVGISGNNKLFDDFNKETKQRDYNRVEIKALKRYWRGDKKGYAVIYKNIWSKSNRDILLARGTDKKGLSSVTETLINSNKINSLNDNGVFVNTYGEIMNMTVIEKRYVKNLAEEYFTPQYMGIPERGLELKPVEKEDYWMVELVRGKSIKINKDDGSIEEVR